MVIPPAIGAADDLHAWILRGWVEAGVPDVTLGGAPGAGGVFSAENVVADGGVEGLELRFPGFDPGEEWVFSAVVAGASVHVACADTLFSHAYAGVPPRELGRRILADARAHVDAFTAWRGQGGQPGLGEQRAIRLPRGTAASRALVNLLERRYSAGQTLVDGPANGWWLEAHAPTGLGGQITTGAGVDPTYRLRGEVPIHERPEYREYAAAMRSWGTWLIGLSVAAMIAAGFALTYFGYNVFTQRADILLTRGLDLTSIQTFATQNAWPLLSFLTSGLFSACWLLAGLRLRALANRTLIRVLLGITMLPCTGVCCFVGAPVGGWVLYRLGDEKAPAVFGAGK